MALVVIQQPKLFAWTPKFAYIVGLITTDGNLSKDKRHLSFTSSDFDLIKTFKKCLELKANIKHNPSSSISQKQSYRIQFGNVLLYRRLLKTGLFPNKSLILSSLKVLNKYFRDFVRGLLDGDGSVITFTDRYLIEKNPKYVYTRLMVYLMSASYLHVAWLQKKIIGITKLHGAIQTKKYPKRERPCYVLKFSKKESIKLLQWIYYDKELPCLKRKWNIAKKFI